MKMFGYLLCYGIKGADISSFHCCQVSRAACFSI